MHLLTSPTSPYCRKVEVVLRETGLADRVTTEPGSGTPLAPNPRTLEANPLGKIPALLRDDAPTLFDSRVICRFLDSMAGGRLYPSARIWEVLTLEALADGMTDAALLMVYEGRLREEGHRSEAWVEAQWTKIARGLEALEDRWLSHLAGPIDMGQIAVGCALGYVDFRHGGRNWRDGHPGLASWERTFAERPAMQATRPRE